MKIKFFFLLIIVTLALLPSGMACANEEDRDEAFVLARRHFSERRITIAAVGDIMVHGRQLEGHKIGEEDYDFDIFFEYIRPHIEKADIAFGNLETTITGPRSKGYTGFPRFNTPEQLLPALKNAGFDALSLANNHMLDSFIDGLQSTKQKALDYGFYAAGSSQSPDDNSFSIIELNGVKVGFLAYTQLTNGLEFACSASEVAYSVNYLNKEKIAKDIATLREQGVNIVVVYAHWGAEYEREPGSYARNMADYIVNAGADLVLGAHPHVVQPAVIKNVVCDDGTERQALVAYSMGNFVSSQTLRYKNSGVIIGATVVYDADTDKVRFESLSYTPTYVWIDKNDNFRIMPCRDSLDNKPEEMDDRAFRHMRRAMGDVSELMTEPRLMLK